MNNNLQTATLAGGCFWCLEAVFDEVKGVHGVESGYAGGQMDNPTYREVCNGNTGHAEVVQVLAHGVGGALVPGLLLHGLLGRAGAAVVVEERELDGSRLAGAIAELIADPARRGRMSKAARVLARPDAAARIADRAEQLGGSAR